MKYKSTNLNATICGATRAALNKALAFAFVLCASNLMTPAQAKVTVSSLFVDGGVIQRDKPVNVFGTAKPGEMVTCEINGAKGVCIVKEGGNFLVTLPPVQGDKPFTLRVASNENLVEIKNLQLGEVWMVAGDKDVDADSLQVGSPIESTELPDTLQLFKAPINYRGNPVRMSTGKWIKATTPGAMTFSAVGLRFGCDLAKRVGGPIAIIQVSCPDSPIKSWISPGGLLSKVETKGAPAKNILKDEDYEEAERAYKESLAKWQSSLVAGQEPPPLPLPSPIVRNNSSTLFNGMLASLTPYSMRGLIWYHGQSDLEEVLNYKGFLGCFIKDFREIFRQPGLPMILVQTGALNEAQKGDESPVSILRNVQLKARVWPKTYMVVSLDLDKKDEQAKDGRFKVDFETLAQRLTNVALVTQYHTPAAANYPIVDRIEPVKDGEALKLSLRYGAGLTYVAPPTPAPAAKPAPAPASTKPPASTPPKAAEKASPAQTASAKAKAKAQPKTKAGAKPAPEKSPAPKASSTPATPQPAPKSSISSGVGEDNSSDDNLKGFSVSSWNHQFFDAEARADGDAIVVESKFVKNPKFVRYCWGNSPVPTLFSKDGLPLVPFTSDR